MSTYEGTTEIREVEYDTWGTNVSQLPGDQVMFGQEQKLLNWFQIGPKFHLLMHCSICILPHAACWVMIDSMCWNHRC
jgi:hypothetical protein